MRLVERQISMAATGRAHTEFPGKGANPNIGTWTPVLSTAKPTKIKMAERRPLKRKGEKSDEFFHIRAKGQFLKVPKGQESDDRDLTATIGMFGHENVNKNDLVTRVFCCCC